MNTPLRGGIDTYRALAIAAGLTIVLGLGACGGGGRRQRAGIHGAATS